LGATVAFWVGVHDRRGALLRRHCHPAWRAAAIGALVAGINADLIGRRGSVAVVAAARPLSARLLAETHQRRPAGARIG
jgi:hypothetical protein